MKAILTAAVLAATPLLASAQGVVVNDVFQGGTVSPTDGPVARPYPADQNFCPDGLQPVEVGGEISCGTPTPGWGG